MMRSLIVLFLSTIMLFSQILGRSLLRAQCTEVNKITASDATPGSTFGYSMAIFGNFVVVGSQQSDGACPQNSGCDSGAAYVYWFNGLQWIEIQKLTASDQILQQIFGWAVAIDGDTIVIGAPQDIGRSGSVYIFRRDDNGSPFDESDDFWYEEAKLRASDAVAWAHFGTDVAVIGSTIVVGAHLDGAGAAYVFEYSEGVWTQAAKLTAANPTSGAQLGFGVSASGNIVAAGARHTNGAGSHSGSVYIFERPVTGWTDMTETVELTASDAVAGKQFGTDLSILGDTLVVGAFELELGGPGSAYVFDLSPGNWQEVARLTASNGQPGELFGISVALSEMRVVVGAMSHTIGNQSGSVYVFDRPMGGWADMTETEQLAGSDTVAGDKLGITVDIASNFIASGAVAQNQVAGAGYVFECALPPPSFIRGDVNSDGEVDISDSIKILGAVFLGIPSIACDSAADGNDDESVDLSDAIYLLIYLYNNGSTISAPFPSCGADPTPGVLTCLSFPACD